MKRRGTTATSLARFDRSHLCPHRFKGQGCCVSFRMDMPVFTRNPVRQEWTGFLASGFLLRSFVRYCRRAGCPHPAGGEAPKAVALLHKCRRDQPPETFGFYGALPAAAKYCIAAGACSHIASRFKRTHIRPHLFKGQRCCVSFRMILYLLARNQVRMNWISYVRF